MDNEKIEWANIDKILDSLSFVSIEVRDKASLIEDYIFQLHDEIEGLENKVDR